jgi:hypothetical protein
MNKSEWIKTSLATLFALRGPRPLVPSNRIFCSYRKGPSLKEKAPLGLAEERKKKISPLDRKKGGHLSLLNIDLWP